MKRIIKIVNTGIGGGPSRILCILNYFILVYLVFYSNKLFVIIVLILSVLLIQNYIYAIYNKMDITHQASSKLLNRSMKRLLNRFEESSKEKDALFKELEETKRKLIESCNC